MRQPKPKVFFRMRNADMTTARWMGIDVMRSLHAPKCPACLFKLLDEFHAFHGVYNTHYLKSCKYFGSRGEQRC